MAATKALYVLCSDLPVYRLLPPPFRAWWSEQLECERSARDADDDAAKAHRANTDEKRCEDVLQRILTWAAKADETRCADATAGDEDEDDARSGREEKESATALPPSSSSSSQPPPQLEEAAVAEPEPESWEDLLSDEDEAAVAVAVNAAPIAAVEEEDDWETSTAAMEEDVACAASKLAALKLKETRKRSSDKLQQSIARGDALRVWWLARKKTRAYTALRDQRDARLSLSVFSFGRVISLAFILRRGY